jgi:hypothetical protein
MAATPSKIISPVKRPHSVKVYDMGKYELIVGNNATDLFRHYGVKEMHGLNLADATAEEVDKTKGNGIYIEGLSNYHPKDKQLTGKAPYKPFVFINKTPMKRYNAVEKAFAVMHETMHIAILLHNWDIEGKEEDVVTMAEEQAKKIYDKIY